MIILYILIMALLASPWIKERIALKKAFRNLLFSRWKTAQKNRLSWRESHFYSFDFNHYEYQKLWEIEIGAEALYLINNGYPHLSISWLDFISERASFGKQSS